MHGLSSDENEGGNPLRRGNCQFERARPSNRAADDNQAVTFRHL